MNKELFPGKKGQTVIEMVIGFALLLLGISFAIILVFGGQGLMLDRESSIQARAMAKEGLDAAFFMKENDWAELSDGEHGLILSGNSWEFSGASDSRENLVRKIRVTSVDDNTKKIESEVSWSTDPLRTQKISLVTLLTNWKNATPPPDPGDTGGSGISGDWQNPRTLGSFDLGPGVEPSGLDVKNKIVYMSARAANQNSPDFFIVDATNGNNPFLISSLQTGPGLTSVDATENYAYVGQNDPNAQLQIINISNPSSPTIAKSFKIPGTSGNDATALSVFYSQSKVYVGLKRSSGPEFNVIDVSDPLNPELLGSYEIDDNVNDIAIAGSKAYLATDKDGAGLMILDISDPGNVSSLGQSYASDSKSVYYVSASMILSGLGQTISAINASDPSSIQTLGSLDVGNTVNAIAVREELAFVGTSNSNREFQVIDISSSSAPKVHSFFNFPQVATGVDYEDNLVYVSVRSNDGLRIITSSP